MKGYTFSEISSEMQQSNFYSSLGFYSSVFLSEANGETERNLSLLWKISLTSGSIQELKKLVRIAK